MIPKVPYAFLFLKLTILFAIPLVYIFISMKVITLKINTAQIVRTTLGQYIEGLSKACKPNIKKKIPIVNSFPIVNSYYNW